jgi:hypothetical protein
MVQLAFRRKLALAVLALALLVPWPSQALPLGSTSSDPLAEFVVRLADWFTAWFGDVGCSWGPNGLCRDTPGSQPPAPTDQPDVGCSADPGGRCQDTNNDQVDVGCSWDPDGRCRG